MDNLNDAIDDADGDGTTFQDAYCSLSRNSDASVLLELMELHLVTWEQLIHLINSI